MASAPAWKCVNVPTHVNTITPARCPWSPVLSRLGARGRGGDGHPATVDVPDLPAGDGHRPDHREERRDGEPGLVDVEAGQEVPEPAADVQLAGEQAADLDGPDEERDRDC